MDLQHDGSTITIDIAHQGERVSEALRKMQSEIDLARKDVIMSIRFIVGSGLIRDEVLLALRDSKFRGDVIDFESEPSNAGAVLVKLKLSLDLLIDIKEVSNEKRHHGKSRR